MADSPSLLCEKDPADSFSVIGMTRVRRQKSEVRNQKSATDFTDFTVLSSVLCLLSSVLYPEKQQDIDTRIEISKISLKIIKQGSWQ